MNLCTPDLNLCQPHLLMYAVLLGVGLALSLVPFTASRAYEQRSVLWVLALTLTLAIGATGFGYSLLLIGSNHGEFLLQLVNQGNDANTLITLMLGLLGIVMTLVTIGIISIADRAVSQIREMKKETRGIHQSFEKRASKHRRKLNIDYGHLMLYQKRQSLLFSNQQALDVEVEDDGSQTEASLFRNILATIYAIGSDCALIEYLLICTSEKLDHLEREELNYLNSLEAFYVEHHNKEEVEELKAWGRETPNEVLPLFDKLSKKLPFRDK